MAKAKTGEAGPLGGAVISQQIASQLLREMRTGPYESCERLPAEVELAARLGVSRTVIRDALAELEREGYVERVRGIGTVVNRRIVALDNRLDQKFEYNTMIRAAGYVPHADSISVQQLTADSHLAHQLELEVGAPVLMVRKRVLAGEMPVIYSVDYLPAKLLDHESAQRQDFARPIFDILEEVCGVSVTSTITHTSAVLGDAAIRKTLEVPDHEALLLMDEISFSKLTRPVMYSLSYYTNFFSFSLLRKKV